MKHIIIYGSRYGSARRYAEKLSEQTGIPAVSCREMPALSEKELIVYIGGLYAGGVMGLRKTLRGFSPGAGQRVLLVTVGLADPQIPENRENIRRSLKNQLSEEIFGRAKIFHLRGAIDYRKLSFGHRTMMKLLYQSLRKTPLEEQTAENRAFMETYGKQADFTDFCALEPIVLEVQKETI